MTFTAPITLPGLALDPQWYRRAVFYEVMVRSFVDSNGDGSGDLGGLIAKLDYLQWLGVDALWIPPFYSSPLRDGGYDVADYTTILPEFGTVDEFRELVTKAHERNMRIIIDLPLNHTSDQHEWFQQSRSDPEGPYGDFYVWSDTDEKYPDIRIIFTDYEDSQLGLRLGAAPVLLPPLLLAPARPQLREPGRARGDLRRRAVLARPGRRRLPARRDPLPLRVGRGQRRGRAADPRVPQEAARRWSTATTPAGS